MLTNPQKQTLKAAIEADNTLNSFPNTPDGNFAIAAALNEVATPTFYVWRGEAAVNEIMQNGFDWVRVDNLSVGKSRIWDWMTRVGTIHPSQANVRAGVLACFSAAGDAAMRSAIFGHFQRPATRAEKLFATGTGTSSNDQAVGPATMALEGSLTYDDVAEARNYVG